MASSLHITFVDVWVVARDREAFIHATALNRAGTRQEPGNLRFDVVCDQHDPTHFVLVEVFVDQDAAIHHKETSHYLQWRETVAPMMAQPRRGVRMDPIDPVDALS